jgi:hypothetical protein
MRVKCLALFSRSMQNALTHTSGEARPQTHGAKKYAGFLSKHRSVYMPCLFGTVHRGIM